jgi:ribokinase
MSGVDTSAIMRSSEPTGVAVIEVDSSARNRIVVVPGANGDLTPADVERHADLITGAQVVLIQLEIPMETVLKAAEIATGAGTRVILDPAPARPLPPELLKMVSFMTPNQGEAGLISGQTVTDIESAKLAARALATSGCKNVIVKLGAEGAMLFVNGEDTVVPGFSVNAVDTTAAGDAFAGGFAAALVWGDGALSAAKFANAVAALSVTRLGAQSSIPWHDEVRRFLKDYKDSHR